MNWITSPEYQLDSKFLWHCWWLPNRYLSLPYAKGIAASMGQSATFLKHRYPFWESQQIAELSHEGGIEVNAEVFENFKFTIKSWKEDRASALKRLETMLHSNLERLHLVPDYCPEPWIHKIIWHWQRIHATGQAKCRAEANRLHLAAELHFHLREVA